MSTWKTNRRTKKPFMTPPSETLPEDLHPYVAKPSEYEPVLTTGQKLTPAQKQHLAEAIAWDYDTLYNHLSTVHGRPLPPAHYTSGLDPQVAERFGIQRENIQVPLDQLQRYHLAEHIQDIEERTRTAPKKKKLTAEEYEAAGVGKAPGFE